MESIIKEPHQPQEEYISQELIPYDQGGPIRIIYPDSSRWSKFLDPWNWSLTRITAK